MDIRAISTQDNFAPKPAFKSMFVTIPEGSLGKNIAGTVNSFNTTFLPELNRIAYPLAKKLVKCSGTGRIIWKPECCRHKVNFFTLGTVEGDSFKELSEAMNGNYNQLNFPFRLGQDSRVHLLDFAMMMGRYFIDGIGVKTITASKNTGSLGDIINYYRTNPQDIRDTLVCDGNNVFQDCSDIDTPPDIMKFFTQEINNPKKHIAIAGARLTPSETANRFRILDVQKSSDDDLFKLNDFIEKPVLETAQSFAIDGHNIVDTSMFYISKEAMSRLVSELNRGINNIGENPAEWYDSTTVLKYIHSMMPRWFGIEPTEGADVKVVKKWLNVNDPKTLFQFAYDVKNGLYLENFPRTTARTIRKAFYQRVHLCPENKYNFQNPDEKQDIYQYLNLARSQKITIDKLANAPEIEGVHIIV